MSMGSKRRNIKKGTSTYKESLRIMEQRLETMEVNGDVFYPCKICKRLFKKEMEAMEHFQICIPQYHINVRGKLNETISEEVDSKGKHTNNNCIGINATTKSKRNPYRRNAVKSSSKQSMETCNNLISVPKKKSRKNIEKNVQSNSFININKSIVQPHNLVKSQAEDNNTFDVCDSSTGQNKNVKPRRRGKRLTEEEIAERLRVISEKLRKKTEVKVFYEDDEEEERQQIEDRLTALNKDSEISFFNGYSEFDDRLKDEDDRGDLESKYLKSAKSDLNSFPFNGLGYLDASTNSNGTIIVTQSPDGQLHSCRNCTEVFVSELELLRHKRAKHTVPKIIMAPSEIKKFYNVPDKSQCPICKRVLVSSNKSIYIKHLQSHTYVGEYECPVCKKKFKRKDQMRMHEKRHIV